MEGQWITDKNGRQIYLSPAFLQARANRSEKTRLQISETLKRRFAKIPHHTKGIKLNEEHKKRISQNSARYWAGKRRDVTPEWRENLSRGLKLAYKRGTKKVPEANIKRLTGYALGKFGREHPKWREEKKRPLYKAIRETFKYKNWRSSIFRRDDFTCVLCGVRGSELNADHYPEMFIEIIKKHNIRTLDEALACLELYDTNNGRTLCVPCHRDYTWGKGRLNHK